MKPFVTLSLLTVLPLTNIKVVTLFTTMTVQLLGCILMLCSPALVLFALKIDLVYATQLS